MVDIGLNKIELDDIRSVLEKFQGIVRAAVFGSRAKGNHKPYSDVDIALFGDLDITETENVALMLDELPLVYKFDVVAYDKINNPMLKKHIDVVGLTIYEK